MTSLPPLLDLGGDGPAVLLGVANGFPPGTYLPMLEPLFARYRVLCLPPRALWPEAGAPPDRAGSWTELADDLILGITHYRLGPVISMGHSFGGTASLLAASQRPDLFRALVLLDPTIIPLDLKAEHAGYRTGRGGLRLPLVDLALRRKRHFRSEMDAYHHWRRKPLFHDWPDVALRRYTHAALREVPDGVELVWPPAWEAYYYRSFYPGTWENFSQLHPDIPMLVISGSESQTSPPARGPLLSEVRPGAAEALIPGGGHLFPQSHPEETATLVSEWLVRTVPT